MVLYKDEYKGIDGYVKFADEYFLGDMSQAYKNIPALLDEFPPMIFSDLKWERFKGTTDQFKQLKDVFNTTDLTKFNGITGQRKIARRIFQEDMEAAYDNVFAFREELLGSHFREAFVNLNWDRENKSPFAYKRGI